ncbi:MAG: hypothetical protein LBU58_02720, partial [Clostridiales bacterium]|nr:hypothetical protein [Clostridiales bacterium]
YGADEDQRSFLYLFQAAAMSDQIASGAVLRYLDAGELGPLSDETSDANRNLADAKEAYAAIAARHEKAAAGDG